MRKALLGIVLTVICCLGRLSAQNQRTTEPAPQTVSLIRLIASPAELDGKRLRVCGYLGANGIDQSVGVFVSEVDSRYLVLSNSISVEVDDAKIRELIKNYVIVSGVFHAPNPKGNLNGYIDQVSAIEKWPPGDVSR